MRENTSERNLVDFDIFRYFLMISNRKHFVISFLVGVSILLVFAGIWLYVTVDKPVTEIEGELERESSNSLFVDVEGAVENPGLYELHMDARVGEALMSAGGLSSGADRNWVARFVNLASPVVDGMKIYIPESGEDTGGMIDSVSRGDNLVPRTED